MKWLSVRTILAIITLIVWTPLLSLILSLLIGSAAGCSVNEGGVQTYMIAGTDVGEALYTMMTLGWLAIAAAPVMLLTMLVWIFVCARAYLRRQKASANLPR